jgi:hypothetical protein
MFTYHQPRGLILSPSFAKWLDHMLLGKQSIQNCVPPQRRRRKAPFDFNFTAIDPNLDQPQGPTMAPKVTDEVISQSCDQYHAANHYDVSSCPPGITSSQLKQASSNQQLEQTNSNKSTQTSQLKQVNSNKSTQTSQLKQVNSNKSTQTSQTLKLEAKQTSKQVNNPSSPNRQSGRGTVTQMGEGFN